MLFYFHLKKDYFTFLAAGTKKSLEKEVEVLIYEQPNHCMTLDRFMQAYEKKYSRRLAHFHGHSKLLKLLEDFADTLEVRCKVIHGLQ